MARKPKKNGRPTKWRKAYDKQAENYCLLGATNDDLATFFDVAPSTIDVWIRDQTTFRGAVKRGRQVADMTVAGSLFKRANGFQHSAQKMQLDKNGVWKTLKYTEKYAPDTIAAIFWLKNRRPDLWRDKHEIESSDTIQVIVAGEDLGQPE